jgi:hypothetical protein
LPTPDKEERGRERAEKRLRTAAESDAPDDRTINLLIGNGDFDTARKLIDKLPDGPGKAQHTEKVNLKEALGLASRGDIGGATLLAERLTKAVSLSQIYSVLIQKCAGRKDAACVTDVAYKAMRSFDRADAAPFTPPAGTPAAFFLNGRESDPVLQGLASLGQAVAPFQEVLAFEFFDKMVTSANRSEVDTALGRVGFDPEVFKTIASINEVRAAQLAGGMDDSLRRIVALAEVSKWKAEVLGKTKNKFPSR